MENGILKGLITVKDIEKKRRYPHAAKDAIGRLRVAAAVGVSDADSERAGALLQAGVDALVIDTAHGFTSRVGDAIKRVKKEYPDSVIVAGNIASADGAKFLCDQGADAVKVGMGPGIDLYDARDQWRWRSADFRDLRLRLWNRIVPGGLFDRRWRD